MKYKLAIALSSAAAVLSVTSYAQLVVNDVLDVDVTTGSTNSFPNPNCAWAGGDNAGTNTWSKDFFTMARGVACTSHGYNISGYLPPQYGGNSVSCYFFGTFTSSLAVNLSGTPYSPGGGIQGPSVGYIKAYAKTRRATVALQRSAPLAGGNFSYADSRTYNAQSVTYKCTVYPVQGVPNAWNGSVNVAYGTVGAYVKLYQPGTYGQLNGSCTSQISIISTTVGPAPAGGPL